MITTKVNHSKGDTLVTSSSYDKKGRHLGFDVVLNSDSSFTGISLEQVLTPTQIEEIEGLISYFIKGRLEKVDD